MSLIISMAGALGNQISGIGKQIGNDFIDNLIGQIANRIPSAADVYTGGNLPKEIRHKKAVLEAGFRARYLQGWQWSVSADGIKDIDLYCKDITYNSIEIETESKQIGSVEFNTPVYRTAGAVSLTLMSDDKRKMENWFDSMAARVINSDGTVNLTIISAFNIGLFRLSEDGTAKADESFYVFAKSRGETTLSRDNVTEMYSFPCTFIKVSSTGAGLGLGGIGSIGSSIGSSMSGAGGGLMKF